MAFWNIGELVARTESIVRELRSLESDYNWLREKEDLRNQHDSLAVENLRKVVGAFEGETLTESVERLTAERDRYKNELKEIRERLHAALGGAT